MNRDNGFLNVQPNNSLIKAIAIHLPQFHPIPENDEWWGKGFTEWTNVAKARPLFKNHYQPHVPADLGFYDLRLEEARQAQVELAKQHGIYGFCHYHYWFNGKRLLHAPLDRMRVNRSENFPFMLCWANENWTRKWDGLNDDILIKQDYNPQDDINHIRFLWEHFFQHKDYIRVDGKPFFVIYRPSLLPNVKATVNLWRQESLRLGYGELHIGFMNNFPFNENYREIGFDCKIDFQPNFKKAQATHEAVPLVDRVKNILGFKSHYTDHNIYSYSKYVDGITQELFAVENEYPGITPSWDNSSRRNNNATIFVNSSPELYERWLKRIKEVYSEQPTFLFINAWNEWAEGCHLEPCDRWGLKYLEATRRVLSDA